MAKIADVVAIQKHEAGNSDLQIQHLSTPAWEGNVAGIKAAQELKKMIGDAIFSGQDIQPPRENHKIISKTIEFTPLQQIEATLRADFPYVTPHSVANESGHMNVLVIDHDTNDVGSRRIVTPTGTFHMNDTTQNIGAEQRTMFALELATLLTETDNVVANNEFYQDMLRIINHKKIAPQKAEGLKKAWGLTDEQLERIMVKYVPHLTSYMMMELKDRPDKKGYSEGEEFIEEALKRVRSTLDAEV